MVAVPIILDFSLEDTMDLTGEALLSLLGKQPPPIPFRASVPPHLAEEAIAHWDREPLWD